MSTRASSIAVHPKLITIYESHCDQSNSETEPLCRHLSQHGVRAAACADWATVGPFTLKWLKSHMEGLLGTTMGGILSVLTCEVYAAAWPDWGTIAHPDIIGFAALRRLSALLSRLTKGVLGGHILLQLSVLGRVRCVRPKFAMICS